MPLISNVRQLEMGQLKEFRQCQRKFAPDEHHGVVAADEAEFPTGLVANVVAENAIAIPLHY